MFGSLERRRAEDMTQGVYTTAVIYYDMVQSPHFQPYPKTAGLGPKSGPMLRTLHELLRKDIGLCTGIQYN